MIICRRCNQPGEFRKGLAGKQCKKCDKQIRTAQRDHISRQVRAWQAATPHRQWAIGTVRSHRQKGFDVRISIPELTARAEGTSSCPICLGPLVFGPKATGRCGPTSPSLDRKDNEQVMTMENTQIICMPCNTTKGPRTMAEFVAYCAAVAARHPT